jgi:hypothetical protein
MSDDDQKRRDEANRRGFANAAGMTFGILKAEALPVEGGWRDARMLNGAFMGWLCPHVHASAQEAAECPEKESILGPPTEDESSRYHDDYDQAKADSRRAGRRHRRMET